MLIFDTRVDDNMLQYSCHILTMFQQTMTIKKTPWVVGNSFQISWSSCILKFANIQSRMLTPVQKLQGSTMKVVDAGRYGHVT